MTYRDHVRAHVFAKAGMTASDFFRLDRVNHNVAEGFVIFRALHSVVHCTFNLVMLRFYLYLIAALAAWFMVVRAALVHFGG